MTARLWKLHPSSNHHLSTEYVPSGFHGMATDSPGRDDMLRGARDGDGGITRSSK